MLTAAPLMRPPSHGSVTLLPSHPLPPMSIFSRTPTCAPALSTTCVTHTPPHGSILVEMTLPPSPVSPLLWVGLSMPSAPSTPIHSSTPTPTVTTTPSRVSHALTSTSSARASSLASPHGCAVSPTYLPRATPYNASEAPRPILPSAVTILQSGLLLPTLTPLGLLLSGTCPSTSYDPLRL